MTLPTVTDLAAARVWAQERQRERRAHPPDPWAALAWIASSHDSRTAVALYVRCGLHPILIHGVADDGACTCPRGADCPAAGKHPVKRGWQTAPLDARALDDRLRDDHRLNLGLRMGIQPDGSRLVTIDVDGEDAVALLAPLVTAHGALPPTLTARTGRGGWHFVYRLRDGVEVGNRAGLAPGVDVRGEGGQVVVAPSLHRSGRRYAWIRCQRPEVLP